LMYCNHFLAHVDNANKYQDALSYFLQEYGMETRIVVVVVTQIPNYIYKFSVLEVVGS
jgi:hypothetical protein